MLRTVGGTNRVLREIQTGNAGFVRSVEMPLYRFRKEQMILVALAIVGQTGCRHIGPSTIVADRLPYNEAIATSWKDQTLLNIVKMRYSDPPFFVDVSQITSGYSSSRSSNSNLSYAAAFAPGFSFGDRLGAMLGLQASFEDRPTISYTPQTSAEFVRNLTTPISPKSVLFLIQSGYDAGTVMDLLVDSINGVNNGSYFAGQWREPDPKFHAFLNMLQQAQLSGNVGMRIDQDKAKSDVVVLFFRDKNIAPELAADINEGKKLLGLKPEQNEFKVVFGATPKADDEIAIMTRSIYRILGNLSFSVDVPPCHLAEGRASDVGGRKNTEAPGFVIHSSLEKPCDSFAAVCYRGYWFWVDDRDLKAKRYFQFLLAFLAQADTGAKEALPLVTIRAN